MPWKHVGDARVDCSGPNRDHLLIDLGDEDHQYSLSIHAARQLVVRGHQAALYQRYPSQSDPCAREELSAVQIRRSRSGVALTFVVDGRLYAINRKRLEEVLDGITLAVRVVERIEDAAQLSDASSRQATLEVY